MRAAYPFANNPYLQETVENLQPAMNRAYYLALFEQLLAAVLARDLVQIRLVLSAYCQRSSSLVIAALADA